MSEWINVNNDLPENDTWVDVWVNDDRKVDIKFIGVSFMEYILDHQGDFSHTEEIDPSHWMKTPDEPE